MNKENKIRIGTFNVAAGLIPDCKAINRLIGQNNLDIVGIQEVDRFTIRNNFDMLQTIGENTYLNSFYSEAMEWHGGGEYGIGILSKYEGMNETKKKYKITGEEDRIFQKVEFKVNDEIKIIFFNTHLSFESREIRQKQVEELLNEVKLYKNSYCIITGDFNFDTGIEEWNAFEEFYCANGLDGKWFNTFLYHEEGLQSFALDNIIVSTNIEIQTVEIPTTPLSDHSLLIAEIIIH